MNKISEEIKSIKNELIFANAAIAVLGILMVAFPETSGNIICRIVGAILCVCGVIRLVLYFSAERTAVLSSFGLVKGAAFVIFGVYFIAKPEFLAAVLTSILAIILIIGSVMKFQYAFDFLRMKINYWWIELIGAVVMAILGIVAFANPFNAMKALMIFIGVSLVIDGIWDIVSIIFLSKTAKEVKKSFDNANMIDVDESDYIEINNDSDETDKQ